MTGCSKLTDDIWNLAGLSWGPNMPKLRFMVGKTKNSTHKMGRNRGYLRLD